jgi:hypothetical protein
LRRAEPAEVPATTLLPVENTDTPATEPVPGLRRRSRTVEVTLRNGRRLRVEAEIAPDTLARLVRALEKDKSNIRHAGVGPHLPVMQASAMAPKRLKRL